jgi:hypothetical protein
MNVVADENHEHNRGNRDTKDSHNTIRRWARRNLQLIVVVCLAVLPFGVVALAEEIGSSGAPSHARLIDGGSGAPIPRNASLPTLCDGINAAVSERSGLGEILRSRGLADQIPSKAASRLGRLGTVRCYADNLEGKLAIVLLNQQRGAGVAITNDRSWVDELEIPLSANSDATAVSGQRLDIVVGHGDDPSSGVQSVSLDSLLQKSKTTPNGE